MSRVKAVILAAGLGTRLRPLTDQMPKCLAAIAGRPILDYWLDLLGDVGVRDVLINSHTFPEQVREYIDRKNSDGCRRIVESYEPTLLGSAGTIAANPGFADDADEIVLVYADNLSDVDLNALMDYHRSHDDPMTMLLFRAANPRACGIAELDSNGRIVSFVEKPEQPSSDLANAGVYVVDADAYREMAAMKVFDIAFDLLPRFVGRLRGWVWDGYHKDIGTWEAYEQAQVDALPLLAARGADNEGRQRAVFLDRDGTLIAHVHYLSDPEQVQVLPGVAESLRRLREAGYRCIAVTNQSALGRGLIDETRLLDIHDRMCSSMAEHGAVLDAIYTCPVVPKTSDRTAIEHQDRKPGPGLLQRAAEEWRIDLSESWMIGDMVSDVLAGRNAGCRGSIMVGAGETHRQARCESGVTCTHAPTVADAVDLILQDREEIRPAASVSVNGAQL